MNTLTPIPLKASTLVAIASRIDRMQRIEKQVRRLNELACNQELTERQETRRDTLEHEYKDLAWTFGIVALSQRDPRGASFELFDQGDDTESLTGVTL